MKKTYYIIIAAFLLGFCFNIENLKPRVFSRCFIDAVLYKEKVAVLENGDTVSYKYMMSMMKNDSIAQGTTTFYYSFLMATKYNYIPANFDVYTALINTAHSLDSLDKNTKHMALFFLRRGADKGDLRCR